LDTDDWAAGTSETLDTVKKTYEDFVEMGSNGTFKNSGQIVLTHEIDNTTMTLAMEFLPKIRAAYKNVLDVTVTIAAFNATGATSSVAAASSTASAAAASVSSAAAPAVSQAASAAAVVNNASATSAGVQVGPNALLMAVFAVAAYIF